MKALVVGTYFSLQLGKTDEWILCEAISEDTVLDLADRLEFPITSRDSKLLKPLWVQAGDIVIEKHFKDLSTGYHTCIAFKILDLKYSIKNNLFLVNLQKIDIFTGTLTYTKKLYLNEIEHWEIYERNIFR